MILQGTRFMRFSARRTVHYCQRKKLPRSCPNGNVTELQVPLSSSNSSSKLYNNQTIQHKENTRITFSYSRNISFSISI